MYCKLLCNKNCMHFVSLKNIIKRCYCQTHYEILKLRRNCSAKDIRDSFLKLSKEYHPDKSNKDTHGNFVKISEAYNVLSKPTSRRDYDLGLAYPKGSHRTTIRYGEPPVWSDETIWKFRDRSKDKYYSSKPYYGVEGIHKISNFAIVIFCIVFTSIGVFIQIVAIRSSVTFRRDEMIKYSAELEKLHANIRQQAINNGDKKQLELMKQKMNVQKDT